MNGLVQAHLSTMKEVKRLVDEFGTEFATVDRVCDVHIAQSVPSQCHGVTFFLASISKASALLSSTGEALLIESAKAKTPSAPKQVLSPVLLKKIHAHQSATHQMCRLLQAFFSHVSEQYLCGQCVEATRGLDSTALKVAHVSRHLSRRTSHNIFTSFMFSLNNAVRNYRKVAHPASSRPASKVKTPKNRRAQYASVTSVPGQGCGKSVGKKRRITKTSDLPASLEAASSRKRSSHLLDNASQTVTDPPKKGRFGQEVLPPIEHRNGPITFRSLQTRGETWPQKGNIRDLPSLR